MKMSQEVENRIKRLSENGLYDREIAKRVGISARRVSYWRKKLGIIRPKGAQYHTLYTMYDGKTSEYLFEGTVAECANFAGIQEATIRQYRSRFLAGQKPKYEIHSEDLGRPIGRIAE